MSDLDLSEFEKWIFEDDTHLWHPEWETELCRLFRKRGKELSRGTVARICDRLLLGPPRGLYRAEISSEDWEHIRKTEIYKRVAALAEGGAELSHELAPCIAAAQQWAAQQRQHWQKHGFPLNEDGIPGSILRHGPRLDIRSLLDVPTDEVARQLRTYRDEFGSQTENRQVFAEFVCQRPRRAVEVVEAILEEKDRPVDLLAGFWSGLWKADAEAVAKVLPSLVGLIERAPEILEGAAATSFGVFLETVARHELGDDERCFFELWDAALDRVPSLVPPEGEQVLKLDRALNDLGGMLTEALVQRLVKRPIKRGSDLPGDLKSRFDRLISSENLRAVYARIVLAQRLWWLHAIAPEWAREQLLARTKWQTDQSEAETAALWSAYFHLPRWDLDLLAAFKCDFLETLRRRDLFDEPIFRNACQLFASMSLEAEGSFSKGEITHALADMGDLGAQHVLDYYLHSFRDSQDEAAELWRRKVGPWIERYWPADTKFRSQELLSRLCEMALLSGDAFPDALAALKKKTFLGQLKPNDGIWWRLTREDARSRATLLKHPREALEFLWHIVPDMPPAVFVPAKTDLRELVEELAQKIIPLGTSDQERLDRLRDRLS